MPFDPDAARRELADLDRIDGPHTPAEADRSHELAQNLRLVESYGIDPREID